MKENQETNNCGKRRLPAVIENLANAIENSNCKITFGLQPNQIQIIEKELERFGGERKSEAKYVKYIWEKLGAELAWEPFTLALYYFRYLEKRGK